ncbi:hypothetical protein [Caminibacter sp.]
MKETFIIKAYLNEDFTEPKALAPYCVEIYLADEDGGYVEHIDFEYKETREEAEKRINEINTTGKLN